MQIIKRIAALSVIAAVLVVSSIALAAFVTVTPTQQGGSNIQKWTADWTSASDGTASTTLSIHGTIMRVTFDPGTPAPTALYDVAITDANGVNLINTMGDNLSATATTSKCPGVPLVDGTTTSVTPVAVAGPVTVSVTNAGNGANGSVVFLVRVSDR